MRYIGGGLFGWWYKMSYLKTKGESVAIKLSNIAITHISLVKKGANGKQVIYKSADGGDYEKQIDIKKSDDEKGVVYGIVYAPDEVDSQGDFTTADEIEKAAYAFMKSLNLKNIDVEHSFRAEDAFVAESWLLKSNDPIFPDEKEGAWAVAIKLESDELKQLAKSGELQGLSMAGTAHKQEVQKGGTNDSVKNLMLALADAMGEMWIDFGGRITKSEIGDEMGKEFKDVMKSKLLAAAQSVDKQTAVLKTNIEALEKRVDTHKEEIGVLKSQNEELKAQNKELNTLNEELKKQLDTIAKDAKEAKDTAKEVAKKSNQKKEVKKEAKTDEKGGIL